MSTTARKLRKRIQRESGTKFIHTQKVGTPFLDRVVGIGFDHKGNQRASVRQSKRNMRLFAATVDTQPPVELDPKPYRIGRKRYTIAETAKLVDFDGHLIFSPRKNYEQDQRKY